MVTTVKEKALRCTGNQGLSMKTHVGTTLMPTVPQSMSRSPGHQAPCSCTLPCIPRILWTTAEFPGIFCLLLGSPFSLLTSV